MKQVTNLITQPLTLKDGTILAAAGTTGSVKQVESLSDEDQRLVDRGFVYVSEVEIVPPPETASKLDPKERSK
jgi:hypothetical protein